MFKAFKSKHHDDITAEKPYSYSTHYIILKNRSVICDVPCDQIENNGSWIEIIEKPVFEEKVFKLTPEQVEKYDAWRIKINKKKPCTTAIGGAYTFCFNPTGLGTVITVKHVSGAELDLTDDNW